MLEWVLVVPTCLGLFLFVVQSMWITQTQLDMETAAANASRAVMVHPENLCYAWWGAVLPLLPSMPDVALRSPQIEQALGGLGDELTSLLRNSPLAKGLQGVQDNLAVVKNVVGKIVAAAYLTQLTITRSDDSTVVYPSQGQLAQLKPYRMMTDGCNQAAVGPEYVGIVGVEVSAVVPLRIPGLNVLMGTSDIMPMHQAIRSAIGSDRGRAVASKLAVYVDPLSKDGIN